MSEAQPIPGYAERLQEAARVVAERKEAYRLALRQRNMIIVEAVDDGYPQSAAAENARIRQPHVTRIIAGSYDDVADLVA